MSSTKLFVNLCNAYYNKTGKLPNDAINKFSFECFGNDIPDEKTLTLKWIRNRGLSALKQEKNSDGVSLWDSTPNNDGYYKINQTESANSLKTSINRVDLTMKGCEKKKSLLEITFNQIKFIIDEITGEIIDIKSNAQIAEGGI